jgi:hypothetical protein
MAQGTAINTSVPEPELPSDVEPLDTEPPGDDDTAADAGVDARAREMGWKPLAEYRGPPGKWQPAADFIERGENILPIVRDQNRRMGERIGKLEGEITSLRSTAQEQLQIIKDMRELGRKADQRGYDRAMAELKTKQREAVAQGDTTTYDQLVEQAEALAGSRPTAAAAPPPAQPQAPEPQRPVVSPAVQAFVGANSWFNTDPLLTRKMIDLHIDVIQEGEIADEGAQLTEARRRLVEDYPERFPGAAMPPAPSRPAARPRAAVAQPTPANEQAPRPGSAPATINSISDPAERAQAREAFNRTKRQLPDYTEAEYMALYADPHADVLVMQKPKQRS